MADRLPFSGEQYWNAVSRNAFPGAKLYAYTSLSRTVLKTIYTDAGAGTPLSNPVIADANGLFAAIFGNGEYFIDIYNSDDTTLIYQEDEVFGTAPANANETTTVSLIADLRLVDTTSFQSAFVEGTTAIDDDGQGRFFFDSGSSAIDNGTTIIAPTVGTGRWLILNVETLAIGDSAVTTAKVNDQAITSEKLGYMPLSSKDGLLVSNGTDTDHDLDIAIGKIADSGQTRVMELSSAITKQIDNAFAVGSNVGGFSDQSTLSTDSKYLVFLIEKVDGTADVIIASTQADALADTVAAAANFTLARRISSIETDSSSNIINWKDGGNNRYIYDTAINDLNTTPSTGGASFDVTVPANKIGIFTILGSTINPTTTVGVYLQQTDQVNTIAGIIGTVTASSDGTFQSTDSSEITLKVSSSSQVRQRGTTATAGINVNSRGWIDIVSDLT